ncbi:MAG: hypothetical protein ACRDJW_12370 [Thermomicrobiales bacterium]
MASTGHLPAAGSARSVARSLFAALALLAVLAACASGTARDAERAEQREATRGVILPGMQQTVVRERFFAPTPSPGATRTAIPTIEELVLATSIGSDGRPGNSVESVSRGGTLYAAALMHDLTEGALAVAVWGTLEGGEIARAEIPIDQSASERWLAFPFNIGSVAPGEYAISVYIDGSLMNSVVFRVS